MKITDLWISKPVTLSFEVFPPKTDDGYESVAQTVTALSAMKPDYISVTYGAGGGTSKNTVRIASEIQGQLGTTALPHLSCVSSTRYDFLERAAKKNIQVPVVVGVMPVTSVKLIQKICAMAGTSITPPLQLLLDKWGENPEAMKQAGIAFATEQIVDLVASGVQEIHIYTMNKPEIAFKIKENIEGLLR